VDCAVAYYNIVNQVSVGGNTPVTALDIATFYSNIIDMVVSSPDIRAVRSVVSRITGGVIVIVQAE